jgi:hypothetical protein
VSDPAAEAGEAMRLATASLPELGVEPDDFRIVRAENLLSGVAASPARWRVVLKSRATLPEGEGKIGKGGEIFVEVNTKTGETRRGRGGD